LALLPAASTLAAVSVGGNLGNGQFDSLSYGTTGTGSLDALLFVGDFAGTTNIKTQVSGTPLGPFIPPSVGGSASFATITFLITNSSPSFTFSDLRFMVDVQADGSGTFQDKPQAVWGPKVNGAPDHYQIVDFGVDGPLTTKMVANNGLSDSVSASCTGVASCDVDLGLEWDLAKLGPGETWSITVGLSDDGQTLSSRYLRATSADSAGTELIFSGIAAIPEPAPFAILIAGLGLLLLLVFRHRSA